MKLVSKDTQLALGRGNRSIDDPVMYGGTLHVWTLNGDAFDVSYPLPANKWRYVGAPGGSHGYRYSDPRLEEGPVTLVDLRSETFVKIKAKGSQMGHSLGSNPNPVEVVLTIGSRRYALSYGGTVTFRANRAYKASGAPPPTTAP